MLLSFVLTVQSWTMVVGGDIMLNGVRPSSNTFKGIEAWTRTADIAVANLEIPLTDARTATARKTPAAVRARQQYILKADPGHITSLKAAGFDYVSLGNNHALDYGKAGMDQMTALLDKAGIEWSGAGKDQTEAERAVVVTTKGGVKVAFVSFLAFMSDGGLWACTPATKDKPGVAALAFQGQIGNPQRRRIKAIVARARSRADVVVASLHWGLERKTVPTLYQAKLGRAFIEAGADCVLGAHPHVLQGAEVYADKPVFYSLGNLVSPRPATTAVFRMTFEGRKFTGVEMLPCAISGGKVTAVPVASRPSAVARFVSLGTAARKAYRHPKSAAMTFSH